MPLLPVAFIAGILTVAAPCILPVLPLVLGSTTIDDQQTRRRFRPLIVVGSLAISVVVFSLLLKATTALLGVPQMVWQVISGAIIVLFGINLLVPTLWSKLVSGGVFERTNKWLGAGYQQGGYKGDIVMGAALGPVFNSCSPTYALIVASILPASFLEGFSYLVAYAIGLAIPLLLIAYLGKKATDKLGWLTSGWLYKLIGVIFIIVGVGIIFGLDKDLQTFILDQGWYNPISDLELRLRN